MDNIETGGPDNSGQYWVKLDDDHYLHGPEDSIQKIVAYLEDEPA